MVVTKFHKDIRMVLMDPKAKGVKEPNYLITTDGQTIFVISPGLNGIEFNKFMGFFNNYPGVLVYQCLYGQGIALLQKNDDQNQSKEFKVISINSSKQIVVPSGWGICFINIGRNLLAILGKTVDENYLDSKPIIEKHGLAYYVVEKKGDISFEQNPNYRVHPQITSE